jgi:SpoVK/Ycf46/Vps4 family AAA+-type ATPase
MAKTLNIYEAIKEKCKAGYPALYVQSDEYIRTLKDIQKAGDDLGFGTFSWTLGRGILRENDGKNAQPVADTEQPDQALKHITKLPGTNGNHNGSILVLRNFHHFLEDAGIQAMMLDAIANCKSTGKMIVLITPVTKLPAELEKELTFIRSRLPNKEELMQLLDALMTRGELHKKYPMDKDTKERIVNAAMGLTTSEAENAFSLAIVRPRLSVPKQDKWDVNVVMDEKCLSLKKSGMLTYYPPDNTGMNQVGGMANLKAWISKRKEAFSDEAKKYGLPNPKGMLMVGPPGGGKSLGARAVAHELGLPLLRCDMGRIFAGLVGASEENSRKVIEMAETMAPCVLWLDEIEKGFAGSGGGGNLDSGVGARVLGTFLTWMQEKTSPVFVYATANNVHALPPELLRKGRFDETFSVFLPDEDERKEIFSIHLNKVGRGKLVKGLNLGNLSKMTEGYSGAEIECAVTEAMFNAFSSNREPNEADLEGAITSTQPLSVMMAEQVRAMQEWCKTRTRPAGKVDAKKPTNDSSETRKLNLE